MKRNNKGFAISIMLYAMVLLIVTIFYIILAIVKNRYNTSEELVDTAVEFMENNDHYASASDRTAPLVIFDHNDLSIGESLTTDNFKIYVYDDNINPSGITMTSGNGSISLSCTPNTNGGKLYRCTLKNPPVTFDNYIDLTVTAEDNAQIRDKDGNIHHNKTEVTKRYYKAKAPSCSVRIIDEKTCNQYASTCTDLTKKGSSTFPALLFGDYAIYQITCTSNSGIDAFFNDNDFGAIEDTNKRLIDFKVTTERGTNSVVIKLIVRASEHAGVTKPCLKNSSGCIMKNGNYYLTICDTYSGTANNCLDLDLPYIQVVSP